MKKRKNVSVKGMRKKTYYYRCETCLRYATFRMFSRRFDPARVKPCSGCGSETRPCTLKEEKEARMILGPPVSRMRRGKKDWYQDVYLKSSLWKEIRGRVLARDDRKCRGCGGIAWTVHHLSYLPDVLAGYRDDLLVSLCGDCHERIEFTEDGGKRSLRQANALLVQMLHAGI